jgi:DNA adenine methylase
VERLKSVQIECRPAIEVIKRHNYSNVLIYADPPYSPDTRTDKQYLHEMSITDHEELLSTLLSHKGMVAISGYNSELYNDALKGWRKEIKKTGAEYYNGASKIECLWMNFESVDNQLKLFG